MTKSIPIILSNIADRKLSALPLEDKGMIDTLFEKLMSSPNPARLKFVEKLKDEFYSIRIKDGCRVIFSIEDDGIFVTDIYNYESNKATDLPDPETLEYYRKIDPQFVAKIDRLINSELELRFLMMKNVLNSTRWNTISITTLIILCITLFSLVTFSLIGK